MKRERRELFRNEKPDGEQALDDFADEGRAAAAENAFGPAAMGSANEICADAWIPHFTDAPVDARPRTGDGPRSAPAVQIAASARKEARSGAVLANAA